MLEFYISKWIFGFLDFLGIFRFFGIDFWGFFGFWGFFLHLFFFLIFGDFFYFLGFLGFCNFWENGSLFREKSSFFLRKRLGFEENIIFTVKKKTALLFCQIWIR